jgi:hypothetical protein
MPLKRVQMLDYHANYAYAPPAVDAVVNTEEIVSARPTDARGSGPFVAIKFRDGTSMTIVRTVDDLLTGAKEER